MEEGWGFVWIMFALKIPIAMLLGIVWWAVRAKPEPEDGRGEDGGIGTDPQGPERHGPRRRGPHGEPALPAPPRTRRPAPSRDRTHR